MVRIWFLLFGIAPKSNKKASPWKFDYPLTNDAKISKLASLRQLKFLRLLIVERSQSEISLGTGLGLRRRYRFLVKSYQAIDNSFFNSFLFRIGITTFFTS